MKKRRLSALISGLCLTATAVTACGGGTTQGTTAASTAAENKAQETEGAKEETTVQAEAAGGSVRILMNVTGGKDE